MNESAIYRVSGRFLANQRQQAFYGSVGVLASWGLFLALSRHLMPPSVDATPFEWLFSPLVTITRMFPHQEREVIRYFAGPGMALAVVLGGLIDFLTWAFVRYEVREDKLVMSWWSWSRSLTWEVVQKIQMRSHEMAHLRSMIISAPEVPPILVRGLEEISAFEEVVRSRITSDAEWSPVPYHLDLTTRSANFVIGLLLPIPIHATWLAGYVGQLSIGTIALVWAWLLVVSAAVVWYRRPLSSRHLCAAELELLIAALLLLLSGLLTLLNWLEADAPWLQFLF